MRVPISHALGWPERIESGVAGLDLVAAGSLHFEAPDSERYPCLGLAKQAWQLGGTAPAILNAANEVAVESFLGGEISFPSIALVIEHVLSHCASREADSLEAILDDDATARASASEFIHSSGKAVAQ
jgi:1-deoxy-D-xylulose-5-phosphate reductoisomerase